MYKFYGQNLQDQFIFNRYFKDKNFGVSIECGAFDGFSESSTKFFEEFLNWTTINIESYPEVFEKLNSNRPKSINLSLGLSNIKDKKTFNHAIHPKYGKNFGNGSLNHTSEHKQDLINQNCKFESFDIFCDTYTNIIDEIMENKLNKKDVDLFVLDVEGHEIDVIHGMKNSKYLPKIFCIEYPFVGIDKLNSILNEMNYTFDIINHNNAFFIKK